MKSIFEGLLKLKFKSLKKRLSPTAIMFYPDGPNYSEKKKNNKKHKEKKNGI